VQDRLEAAVAEVAAHAGRAHASRNLCIAGGVGANCKLNGSLLERAGFERVFVFPACYDAGTSIGAAMVVAQAGGDAIKRELRHAYHGPEFSADAIRAALRFGKLGFTECDDIAERTARALAAGKLVGWFQGRMELGPRALGARSILADPRRAGVKETLNREVKSREAWRPFSPSILEGREERYVERAGDAAFMTLALPVRSEGAEAMRPATHVDGSSRPQVVRRDANPRFHALLESFERESGLPFLINTSFNVAGEPIVCTPLEALRSFYSSGLDVLAIGDFLLEKT
jgi:carbamoyltransferase